MGDTRPDGSGWMIDGRISSVAYHARVDVAWVVDMFSDFHILITYWRLACPPPSLCI